MSNDAWKGEDDEVVGHSIFGSPITRKQQRAFDEAHAKAEAERKSKAAVAAMTLPAFGASTSCTKCGSQSFKRRYCEGESWCFTKAGEQEHMHLTCRECKYTWYEHVLNRES